MISAKSWLANKGWSANPFIFSIYPELLVGYEEQRTRAMVFLEERHKIILLLGPTGAGKTTMLKWLSNNLQDTDKIFISKPPTQPNELAEIFYEKFRPKFTIFHRKPTIHNITDFLNKQLKRHTVVLFDEAHESPIEMLEWIRVISDQVEKLSFVLSALPSFEEKLMQLETLKKRVAERIELSPLTKEKTIELIKKRIQNVGGTGEELSDMMDNIYSRSGGFPRDVLRLCDEIVNNAILGEKDISPDIPLENGVKEPLKLDILDKLTPLQHNVIMCLSQPKTPGQIADTLDLEKYKSRQHAVRSINNVLCILMKEGHVERHQTENTFVYNLTPRTHTLTVKA